MHNYNHCYTRYANKTLNWLSMDSEELYKNNLSNRYDDLKKYGWLNNKFTYKFNSFGFRCEEFSDDPTLMALGCSFTAGVGLPLQKIWPTLVSKKLNLKCANLGIGGGSHDTAFRLCHGFIDKIIPKIVILMGPPIDRIELLTKIDSISLGPNYHQRAKEFYKRWTTDDENSYFNSEKNRLGIQMLCTERNIKFVYVNWNVLKDEAQKDHYDLARDLTHPGVNAHQHATKKILTHL